MDGGTVWWAELRQGVAAVALELMRIKNVKKASMAIVVLAAGVSMAWAGESPTFAERVSEARRIEQQESTRDYVREQVRQGTGAFTSEAIRMCTNHPCASTEPFVVVARVTEEGALSEIEYEPKTDASECFVNALARLRLPAPPPTANGSLPIVLEIQVER